MAKILRQVAWSVFALLAYFSLHVIWLLAAGPQSSPAQTPLPAAVSTPASPQRELLNRYCVTCHNARLRTGQVVLDQIDLQDVGKNAAVLEKVLHKIRRGEMPPARLPRPDAAASEDFTAWLEASLDRAAAMKPDPGRVAIHRLNQVEYANAIRDLLALEIDARSLLIADDADQQGFENIAGVLSVSPASLDRYLAAARKISSLAVGDPGIVPVFDTYEVPKLLEQTDRISEDLPFGSAGGIAVRHRFAADAEYVVKVRLRRQLYDYILGLGRPHLLEVRLDGALLKRFTVGGDAPGKPAPVTFAGNMQGDSAWEIYMHTADDALEIHFPAKAGTRTVGVSFVKNTREDEGVLQPRATSYGLAYSEDYDGDPAVDSVLIGGPYQAHGPGETSSRRKIFVCHPASQAEEIPCARRILSTLARGAYRRPVGEEDVQTLLGFYAKGLKQGGFDQGIQLALERVLADPEFLFRVERAPSNAAPGTVYRVGDVELASRLSFFLWSSIPDGELLDLAVSGKLKDPVVLERQVRRMLSDSRSQALIDNFTSQWLSLGKLRGQAPDPDLFPEFDENLRQAFAEETRLFVESQMREDRSVLGLLTADYSFVNERLARHYQIPGIYGSHFRRVTFNNEERGGLLTQGSILTVTSYANRTSPVLRGRWLLDNILGSPPPPPPPNVPGLKESGANGKATSVRDRMEEHRKNPACAVCHMRMDPLGFALENFDPIGKWRTTSDGLPIDAGASLPDGTKFEGVAGLRRLLLNHRAEFAATFTQKLLTYALGREVDYFDMPAVRKITREAAASDYRWSAIVMGIVRSVPFQMSIVKSAPSQLAARIPEPAVSGLTRSDKIPLDTIRRSEK
jgi:mono/diheme cytochrome c family protein